MMRANGRFGAQELDFEFWPSRSGHGRSVVFSHPRGRESRWWRASRSVLLTEKSYATRPNAKSSPLIERNDVTLRAKANAAGVKSARASPLILEESEGLAALAARQRGRVWRGRKQNQQGSDAASLKRQSCWILPRCKPRSG